MATRKASVFSEYGKITYDMILLEHIQNLGKQILKLPHETMLPDSNIPTGVKYEDIIKSYADGVEHLESMLAPYATETYREAVAGLERSEETLELFTYAKKKYSALMRLCDEKGFLLSKIAVKTPIEDGDDEVQTVELASQ